MTFVSILVWKYLNLEEEMSEQLGFLFALFLHRSQSYQSLSTLVLPFLLLGFRVAKFEKVEL